MAVDDPAAVDPGFDGVDPGLLDRLMFRAFNIIFTDATQIDEMIEIVDQNNARGPTIGHILDHSRLVHAILQGSLVAGFIAGFDWCFVHFS